MTATSLLTPADCTLVLVDERAGLALAAGSADRQSLRSNAMALARTARAFNIPVVVSTSASKVYGGPPPDAAAARSLARYRVGRAAQHEPVGGPDGEGGRTVHRPPNADRGLPADRSVRQLPGAIRAGEGYAVYVAADAGGGLTRASHDAALRRMEQAGAVMTSWLQFLLEMQRDWTRDDTYEAARGIVVDHGGGYGIGLDHARDMIHPA